MHIKTMRYDLDMQSIDREASIVRRIHTLICNQGIRSDIPAKHRYWEYGYALQSLKDLDGKVEEPIKVLDIGAGWSPLGPALISAGCHVTEYDIGEGWKDSRMKTYRDLLAADKASIIDRDKHPLHLFPIAEYDAVFCISVLEHCTKSERSDILTRATICLKPGGVLFLTADIEHPTRESKWRSIWKEPYLTPDEFVLMLGLIAPKFERTANSIDLTYYEDLDDHHDYSFIKAKLIKRSE